MHGGWEEGNGAYAQYVKVDKGLTIALPNKISFEEGATLPLASITAALVIFQQLGFPFPGQGKKEVPFLVWGGASSVGMYAIQFANLAGANVIAVASKNNHDLLKSLGASHTFDYRDADVIDQIKKASGGGVEYGIDTVSEAKTVAQCSKAYKSNGQIGLLLPVDKAQSGDSLTHKNVLMYAAVCFYLTVFLGIPSSITTLNSGHRVSQPIPRTTNLQSRPINWWQTF